MLLLEPEREEEETVLLPLTEPLERVAADEPALREELLLTVPLERVTDEDPALREELLTVLLPRETLLPERLEELLTVPPTERDVIEEEPELLPERLEELLREELLTELLRDELLTEPLRDELLTELLRDELLLERETLLPERVEALLPDERLELLEEDLEVLEPLRELPPPRVWAPRSTDVSARAIAAKAASDILVNLFILRNFYCFSTY